MFGVCSRKTRVSMLISPGVQWRPRRRQLTPTFHYDILKDFVDVFSGQAQVMCNLLVDDAVAGREIDLHS